MMDDLTAARVKWEASRDLVDSTLLAFTSAEPEDSGEGGPEDQRREAWVQARWKAYPIAADLIRIYEAREQAARDVATELREAAQDFDPGTLSIDMERWADRLTEGGTDE